MLHLLLFYEENEKIHLSKIRKIFEEKNDFVEMVLLKSFEQCTSFKETFLREFEIKTAFGV